MAVVEQDLAAAKPRSGRGPALEAQSVVVVAFPGVVLLDAAQTLEVLAAAGRAVAPAPGYHVLVSSPTGCSVPTSCGVRLGADAAMREIVGNVDSLIVLGGWDLDATLAYPGLLPHIRRLGEAARRITGVCNGRHLLRAAGLLEQRRTEVRVTGSGIDAALWMTGLDYGDAVRTKVVGWLGGCSARERGTETTVEEGSLTVAPDSPLRRIADAVMSNPADDHSVGRMAEMASISERHLNRLFLAEMGMGPARFVQRVRVEAARAVLERREKSIESVALECGFGSAETMRRAFLRVLGVSPSAYRDRSSGCTQC
jgi:transcriptional regulator GlxA family with amidase domain